MATVLDVVKDALRLIRVINADETPSASDSSTALYALNSLLGRWSAQPNTIYQSTTVSKVLTPGDGYYTLADLGSEITRVEQAFIRQNNTDIELLVFSKSDYESITDKTSGGTPSVIHYARDGGVYLWPVPSQADTLRLIVLAPYASVALSDSIVFPVEYQDALTLSLAKRIAPEYGAGLWNGELQGEYEDAVRTMKAMNLSQSLPEASFDLPAKRNSDVWFVKRNFPS